MHASCVALMHAGIPLRGMLGACTVALTAERSVLLDPTRSEAAAAAATATFAFLVRLPSPAAADGSCELLLSHATGGISRSELESMVGVTGQAAQASVRFCRQAMLAGRQPLAPPALSLGKLTATETLA
jgi:ribonuclease PH